MKANLKVVLAALTLSLSSVPFAHADSQNFSDSSYPNLPKAEHQKTRAEVRETLAEARRNGTLTVIDSQYPEIPESALGKTRMQVKNELQQSKASGEYKQFDSLYRG
ncbi:DUF4148 domain-containing protein [Herminiimonas fonticola]|uniref:Uncharacterized protein DUF4148 n=1 Tax=Herminiimonas fonticola TaxID=303380 RepID=A0A4R6G128_9BURK|nr:DUF4148 domain-containing protein [Herminiimonas fonticola]RBA23646.1 hypothetical protein Hfont_2457 [Herminiimonas fonticola]TDN88051.1 uncharacterized protein DUF4148 [Herminiimonas fonticola]